MFSEICKTQCVIKFDFENQSYFDSCILNLITHIDKNLTQKI